MTIRAKLGIFYGSLLSGVVVLASLALYLSERHFLLSEMEKSRQSLLESFAQNCRDALLVRDDLAAINAAISVGKSLGVLEAFCVDPNGRIVAHSNLSQRGTLYLKNTAEFVSYPGGVRQGRWNLGAEGAVVGLFKDLSVGPSAPAQVVIVYSEKIMKESVRKTLSGVVRRILRVFSLALGIGLLGSLLIARSLTKPLRRIAVATHQIAQGNLSHRIEWNAKDEIGQLAGDFNVMAARLGELDQMKNDFVSNVTHELRSPLSAIESYANLVTEDWRNGRSRNLLDYITIVRNNATRLRKFVTDILDLSKIDAGTVEIEKERFAVGELIEEIVDLFRAKAREKDIAVSVNSPVGLTVTADMDKVRQILTNLVSNALKFTPAGGRVILSAEGAVLREGNPSRFTRLTVADNGAGIPEKDQARIFDRFEQVKEMRESIEGQKGTGLGLAIVRQLVAAHGGQIDLVSAVGQGSAFSLYFPEGESDVR